MAFITRMHDLVNAGSQFIIATHSPIIMAYPQASIFVLGEDGVRQKTYEETDHYQVSREFLLNPAKMLGILLEEGKS